MELPSPDRRAGDYSFSMRTIRNTIDIAAPPHEVYVALRTLDGYHGWLHRSVVYRGTRAADAR